jgi:hypothetical protein
VNETQRKQLALGEKECEALRSQLDDLLRECWEWELREAIRLGPPPRWEPDRLDVPVPPKADR